jgi:hypothetical protein
MYGDPEEIRRLAGQFRLEAELTRAETTSSARAHAVQWKSLAAQHYRAQLGDAARRAGSATGELEKLSDLLLRHAAAVQEQLDQIAAAERWFRSQAERAGQEARNLGSAARAVGGTVVAGVTDFVGGSVDWVQRLPGGDRGWLEAARDRGWPG